MPLNIPNFLTLMRILTVPIFGYMMHKQESLYAAIIFIAAWLTDILDGFIARKYNLVTNFGKVADPAADKLLTTTALFFLAKQKTIPIPILIIVVCKELLMGLGGYILYKKKKRVSGANWYGKIATAFFYSAIVLLIFLPKSKFSIVLTLVAVIAAVFALLMYTKKFFALMNEPVSATGDVAGLESSIKPD